MNIGEIYSNFELKEKQFIAEENSTALIFEHVKTRARLLKLVNDENNKVFGIGFRTPPNNSTGVAHILEHTVLNGSKKYTTKEPFMDLLKSSLQTFLNAMTFGDKTIYPVSSRNERDFHNLMDVYLDAVFNPRIYEAKEIFMQEGWHYDIKNEDDPLKYKGVVYNEMKGAMSGAEDQVMEDIMKSLYPETIYRHNSGGDPYEIPNLSYEEFLDFHRKYYHPSNSYIFLYGNGDTAEELSHIEQFLEGYSYLSVDSSIELQEPFREPRAEEAKYSMLQGEDPENKAYLSLNYSIGLTKNTEDVIMNYLLTEIFIDSQASPLRKALLENNLCEDIISGYSEGIHQTFSIVAKNTSPDKKPDFEDIVRRVFSDIVENGLDKKLLMASLNKLEFMLRERQDHSAKGVISFITAFNTWLYDGSPIDALLYDELLEELKGKIDSGYFEQYVSEKLLNNPHRTLLVAVPEPGLYQKLDRDVDKKLESYKENLSRENLVNLLAENKKLESFQTREDSPEAKATIPKLSLEDVTKRTERIELEVKDLGESKILLLDEFTNSISYIKFLFNMDFVELEDIPYVSLLSSILGGISTENYSYSDLSNEIYLNAGDVSVSIDLYSDFYTKEIYPKFTLSAKCISDRAKETLEIMSEIATKSLFDDKKRMKELILEIKSRLEMAIYDSGHVLTMNRALSYFNPLSKYNELIKGFDFYFFIQDLDRDFDSRFDELVSKLTDLYNKVFNKNKLLINLTMEMADYESTKDSLSLVLDNLSSEKLKKADLKFDLSNKKEGILSSANVQYVSKAFDLSRIGTEYSGSMEVLANILNMDFLHNSIRAIGGAYGAGIKFYKSDVMATYSYRDPNLKSTIETYDSIGSYLRNLDLSSEELESAVIGSMSAFDPLLTVKNKSGLALSRYINNASYEDLDRLLNEALNTDLETLKSYADVLDKAMKGDYLCVLGNEETIKKDSDLFNNLIKLKR